MKLKTYLVINVVLAAIFGLGSFLFAGVYGKNMGLEVTEGLISFTRTSGAYLIALAMIIWVARNQSGNAISRGLLWAILFLQAEAAIQGGYEIVSGQFSSSMWGVIGMHALLALGATYYLVRDYEQVTAIA